MGELNTLFCTLHYIKGTHVYYKVTSEILKDV